jgi:hypothetical protein
MENNDIFYSFANDLINSINDLGNNDSYCKRYSKRQKITDNYYINFFLIEDVDDEYLNINENDFQRKPYKKWRIK